MEAMGAMGDNPAGKGAGRGRGQRTMGVKNKAPAPLQITAEQILREAMERQEFATKPPKQSIADSEELEEFQVRKRKGFEDAIRRNRGNIGAWLRYADFEVSQRDFERARSVFERAIDVDYRATAIWLRYAEMEMKHKHLNAARNIWDRAVVLLPRVDQFWLKYSHFEYMVGNYTGARQIFERWMEWQPEVHAWQAYIRFELRCGEIERARQVYKRFVEVDGSVKAWLRWAKFEGKHGNRENVRAVYEQAIEVLGEDANDEKFFISFAKFEEGIKEVERARAIYKYALDHIPKKDAQELYKLWISFEKKHGDRIGIEDVIIGKRRFQYEEQIKQQANNYDTWFDYVRLEETYGDIEKTRDVYERAIANLPPVPEKKYWRRYIYLWINYALFEEMEARDAEKAREVYKSCVTNVPHKNFSFSKIWIMFANFEIRQKNLAGARKIYGQAIGLCRKPKVFESYIQLELQLGYVDRCRTIYEKYLEFFPSSAAAWIKFANFEKTLGEIDRSRAIFELAISQEELDLPELLWKSFIDFETDQGENERVRELYQRLLERTKHVKVWISLAQFEASLANNAEKARAIYAQAFDVLKEAKEERVMLLDSWKQFENEVGDKDKIAEVEKKTPKRIIKKRPVKAADGSDAGFEEYYDFIFPGEDTEAKLKILERAKQWKKMKLGNE
eukprot:TRINITY_DN6425_c0_g2_i1.p1 TRINITY_DN6425_c0_g2~~TRINITY_DN6425_c0_g2_i1.p1  ORF type:complete len:676 (+),score=218.34 TRINITY_DN6425_c0_g2_i1:62-2089(+)